MNPPDWFVFYLWVVAAILIGAAAAGAIAYFYKGLKRA